MQKSPYYITIALIAAIVIGVHSCKKINGINNNTVIEMPFSLYFSDTNGALLSTTDGRTVKEVFPPDGYPCRAICVSGNNILWAKTDTDTMHRNLYISSNDGVNFNHAYDSLQHFTRIACTGVKVGLNQSMIIDIPKWNSVYTVTDVKHNPGINITDYLGVTISSGHGAAGTWYRDGGYDTLGGVGTLPVYMISYTMLPNGVLMGLAYDPDTIHFRNFYKTDQNGAWHETTAGYHGTNYSDTAGITLPPNAIDPDTTGFFTLGHYNNRLIAIDERCHNGAWYSDDSGRHWAQYAGLPANTSLLCIASPFEQVCLIGTYGAGLYILNPNTGQFQPNNNGLGRNLIVRGIAAKERIYKNNVTKQYIYLSTNQGIYESTDGGHNWTLTIQGNFVAIY